MDPVIMANKVGGLTETKDATEETQKICDQMKSQVEEKTKKTYEEFTAIQFRSQVVAGKNFLIKVHVGGCDYHLLKVFQNLSRENFLSGVQEDHGKDDPIKPF